MFEPKPNILSVIYQAVEWLHFAIIEMFGIPRQRPLPTSGQAAEPAVQPEFSDLRRRAEAQNRRAETPAPRAIGNPAASIRAALRKIH